MVEPLLPAPARHPRGGRPEKHPRRDVVDAILYVVRSGCAWRALPVDFPPWETVYWYFTRWEQQRLTFRMVDALRAQVRTEQGREAEPSAGLMDSQSVKGAETVGTGSRGYDAGKKTSDAKDCHAAAGSGSWVGMGKAVASSNVTRCARQWWRQPIMRLKRLRWAAV